MHRPTVNTRCVANRYAGPHERIIEFSANDGTDRGGLISFRRAPVIKEGDTHPFMVDIYRTGRPGDVIVRGGTAAHPDETASDEKVMRERVLSALRTARTQLEQIVAGAIGADPEAALAEVSCAISFVKD